VKHRLISLGFGLSLAACAVGPNYHRPTLPQNAGYGAARPPAALGDSATAQSLVVDLDLPSQWWTVFHSAALEELVGQSLKTNTDVIAAQAALRQAHELYLAQRTSFLPTAQGSFGANRSEFPPATLTSPTTAASNTYTLYTAQLTVAYSPDLFGLTRRQVEIAKAQEQVSRFQLEATYLTLSSNVVATAIQEASLRAQIAATRRLLELQHQVSGLIGEQRKLGTASELDLLAQVSLEAQTAQTLPPLEKQLGLARDELTALLGRLPSDEPAQTFHFEDLTLPTQLPLSLPAKLVEQRPDVRQAEESLHAATAAAGVATANLLPQFAISGDLGSSALKLGKLFTSYTEFWDAGATLTQTLFDAGALRHRRKAAYAAMDEAAAQYRGAIILACQNVADTLRALQADAASLEASAKAEAAAKAAFELARRQHELGTIGSLSLMSAEQTYRQAELTLVQTRAAQMADTAALFQALGGGWWNRQGEKP
jgi:NodT family efflux transporter outer membrane factor (OMF) lipoprotein